MNQVIANPDVAEAQAGQLGDVAVILGVQAGLDNINEFDGPRVPSPRLEEFLLTSSDSSVLELLFDNGEAFADLLLIDAGAVPAQQELYNVRGYGILPRVRAHEVLPDQVSVIDRRCQPIEGVQFQTHDLSPTNVDFWLRTAPPESITTTTAAAPSCLSSSTTRLTSPLLPTSFTAATMVDPACFQFVRRSTRSAGSFESTFTLHLIPRQSTETIDARTASTPCSTTISGTTHSCKLTPPWAYFSPDRKLAIPGGEAIRMSTFQCHRYEGTAASPFTTAHLDHFVAAK